MAKKPSHATVPLKKTTPLLYTSCNVHVRYPQSGPAAQNRETVTRDICRAVDTIRDIAEGGAEAGGQTQQDQGKKVSKYFILCKAGKQTTFSSIWQKRYLTRLRVLSKLKYAYLMPDKENCTRKSSESLITLENE
jgi:hypothetical protein